MYSGCQKKLYTKDKIIKTQLLPIKRMTRKHLTIFRNFLFVSILKTRNQTVLKEI